MKPSIEVIDYTKRRKGGAIVVCAKCGRKGKERLVNGRRWITHVSEVSNQYGFRTSHDTDCCIIQPEEEGS